MHLTYKISKIQDFIFRKDIIALYKNKGESPWVPGVKYQLYMFSVFKMHAYIKRKVHMHTMPGVKGEEKLLSNAVEAFGENSFDQLINRNYSDVWVTDYHIEIIKMFDWRITTNCPPPSLIFNQNHWQQSDQQSTWNVQIRGIIQSSFKKLLVGVLMSVPTHHPRSPKVIIFWPMDVLYVIRSVFPRRF